MTGPKYEPDPGSLCLISPFPSPCGGVYYSQCDRERQYRTEAWSRAMAVQPLHWGLVPKMSGICHKTRSARGGHLHLGGTSGWVVSPRFLPVPWTWICADVRLES